MSSAEREPRFGLISLSPSEVLDVFRQDTEHPFLPILQGIPNDAVIDAVTYDFPSHRFLFRLWSSEFDVVPDGEPAPSIGTVTVRYVDLPIQSAANR